MVFLMFSEGWGSRRVPRLVPKSILDVLWVLFEFHWNVIISKWVSKVHF